MTALFGVPLFGTLFVPVAIGAATVFLFWMFVLSKKNLHSTITSDELQKHDTSTVNSDQEAKPKPKEKKKKSCGDAAGCCGNRKGKSGSCSSQKAIEIAKVFVDKHSNISQEFATVLSKQLSMANLTSKLIPDSDAETVNLIDHADGSLCIFLVDLSILGCDQHWLQSTVSSLANAEKPLTGMKYTVFMFQSLPLDKSKVELVDQLLHKSGAVRVCKADSTDISSALTSSFFDDWAEELFSQVQRWNEPKREACKCGPEKKTVENDESCSSKCSDSEEDQSEEIIAKPVLDLEDIAKLL